MRSAVMAVAVGLALASGGVVAATCSPDEGCSYDVRFIEHGSGGFDRTSSIEHGPARAPTDAEKGSQGYIEGRNVHSVGDDFGPDSFKNAPANTEVGTLYGD